MTVEPKDEPRRDTRGLPEGFDPRMLYEYRFSKLKEQATGVEWFLYKYIPYSIIRSFAVAIDPTAPFKVAPGVVTPANRKKYRATASVLQYRKVTTEHEQYSYASFPPNYNGVGGCWAPFVQYLHNPTTGSSVFVRTQEALPDVLNDTTSKTRLLGSKQGELDLFKSVLNSPPRSLSVTQTNSSTFSGTPGINDNCIAVGGSNVYKDGGFEAYRWKVSPTAAVIPRNYYDFVMDREKSYNAGLIQLTL